MFTHWKCEQELFATLKWYCVGQLQSMASLPKELGWRNGRWPSWLCSAPKLWTLVCGWVFYHLSDILMLEGHESKAWWGRRFFFFLYTERLWFRGGCIVMTRLIYYSTPSLFSFFFPLPFFFVPLNWKGSSWCHCCVCICTVCGWGWGGVALYIDWYTDYHLLVCTKTVLDCETLLRNPCNC